MLKTCPMLVLIDSITIDEQYSRMTFAIAIFSRRALRLCRCSLGSPFVVVLLREEMGYLQHRQVLGDERVRMRSSCPCFCFGSFRQRLYGYSHPAKAQHEQCSGIAISHPEIGFSPL